MRIFIAVVMTLFLSVPALAEDSGWFKVVTSKDNRDEYSIKLGSGEITQNKEGEDITVVVGRLVRHDAKVFIYKWYVTNSDCAREYGNLTSLDIEGNYILDSPYAKGSGSIASAIAETICAAADASKKVAQNKGI